MISLCNDKLSQSAMYMRASGEYVAISYFSDLVYSLAVSVQSVKGQGCAFVLYGGRYFR